MDLHSSPILIVDDHLEMTRLARRFVQRLGFRYVDEANDGAAALELLRRTAYRILLVDLNMRPTTGPELIKKLREDCNIKAPSIIVMSGSNTPADITTVKQLGVSGYVLKPFSVNTLKQNLVRVLGAF